MWHIIAIDQFHTSQNAPVPYPQMPHSEQKCTNFCSEWSIVGFGTGVFWDLWIRLIVLIPPMALTCISGAPFNTVPWWRHQMETFSALLAICAGNSLVTGEFPAQRAVTLSFDDFFDLRLNNRLSKQWRGWRFETLSRPLWRHYNAIPGFNCIARITNDTPCYIWNIIAHPRPNFNGVLTKSPWKLGYLWSTTSHVILLM